MNDPALARARLERHAQASQAPALSADEVTDLLAMARTVDANGVAPDGTGYVPTWTDAGLERAASVGWLWKAGKAKYDVKAGSTEAKRSQMEAICRRQADAFAGRSAPAGGARIGSIAVASSLAGY